MEELFGRKRSILSQHAMSVQEEGFNGTESTNIYKPQAANLERYFLGWIGVLHKLIVVNKNSSLYDL